MRFRSHGSHTIDTNLVNRPPEGGRPRSHLRSRCNCDMRIYHHTLVVSFGNLISQWILAESEDVMGARRMPWRRKPMKGAASRDSPGGGANVPRSRGARMGEPAAGHAAAPAPESIGCEEATRGTETSKYPEEEKSTEIPRVAASESGRCPNRRLRHRPGPLDLRCCGGRCPGAPDPGRGHKPERSRTAWEGRRHRVRAP